MNSRYAESISRLTSFTCLKLSLIVVFPLRVVRGSAWRVELVWRHCALTVFMAWERWHRYGWLRADDGAAYFKVATYKDKDGHFKGTR